MNRMTRMALVRHGQTAWNCAKRLQGQTDTPLTCRGWRQALGWGRQLQGIDFDGIISSDLQRARQTALAINQTLRLPMALAPGLREQDWGLWCGCSVRELRRRQHTRLTRLERSGWHFCPPGGESRLQVTARGLQTLATIAERRPGQTLLLITHQGMLKCLCYALTQRRFLPAEPALLKPGYLHWLNVSRRIPVIERLNAIALKDS